VTLIGNDRMVENVPPPRSARALALQLWLTSMLCWWVIGITFSRLWWLVNASQLRWILFCYAWEVPAVGWTGAVLLPYVGFRRLQRRLEAGDPDVGRDLARYPMRVALLVIGTSSFGYLLGAIQIDHFAHLPVLEFAKITLQGPVLGGLFAVAAYLMAERAVQHLGMPRTPPAAAESPLIQPLYGKILSITLAVAVGVAVPVFVFSLTQWQRLREQTLAEAMLQALHEVPSELDLTAPLSQFGPHTEGFVVRRSNNFVVGGDGRGRVLFGDGRRDFQPIQLHDRGWFASRDGEHKVVAYEYRQGVLPDGDGVVLVAVSPFRDYGRELAAAAKPGAIVAAGALAIALALATMLARSIVNPIERLRAAAVQMANGDLAVEPVALVRGDEVAALAGAFDRMAARVRADGADLRAAYDQLQRTQAQLVQHERLSAIGRLASGVAHELNNPLTAVLHLAEDLRQSGSIPPADREALELIGNQARRCRSIVHDLLSFVHGRDRRPEPTALTELAASTRRGVDPILGSMGVSLEVSAEASAPVLTVDRLGLEQVLTNLIVNGAQAAGRGGRVRVDGVADGGGWRMVVEDDGPGIPPDVLPRIFEPFFTTRPVGEGTGLGLAVSLGIVERHGGKLQVESRGGGMAGARFTVAIPGAGSTGDAAAGYAPAPAPGLDRRSGRPRALIIDDEPSVRMALTRYFERTGWDVDQAEDGEVALRMLGTPEASGYALVISDLRMPVRNGLEVHDWLAAERPALFARLIIATGDVASPMIREFLQRTPRPVLEKPFELSTLAALVKQVAGGG
jgi:signal transduction histidine kinase/CheY-like chemotaxis protein